MSWLQAGGCEVDELPGPGMVLWYDVSPFDIYQLNFALSYHLIPVHLLHSAIMAGYYSMHLFPVLQVLVRSIGVIAHVFCPADVLVCWFVVTVANFGMLSLQNRLSNSKLHYEFMVLYFWLLSFAWDPSISFQSHFCCSYFVYSFLFGIRLCWLLL